MHFYKILNLYPLYQKIMIFRNLRNFAYRIGLVDARHDELDGDGKGVRGGGGGAGGSGVVLLGKGQMPAGVCVDRQDTWQKILKSALLECVL
jgi:hypothetical protein